MGEGGEQGAGGIWEKGRMWEAREGLRKIEELAIRAGQWREAESATIGRHSVFLQLKGRRGTEGMEVGEGEKVNGRGRGEGGGMHACMQVAMLPSLNIAPPPCFRLLTLTPVPPLL